MVRWYFPLTFKERRELILNNERLDVGPGGSSSGASRTGKNIDMDSDEEVNIQAWASFRYAITVASNSVAVGLSMVGIMSCINGALDLSAACDLQQGAFRGCRFIIFWSFYKFWEC